MRRKTDFYEIQVPYKFESIEECDKKISALVEFIRYHAKNKGYFCQGIIIASETSKKGLLGVKKELSNQRGRPKTIRVISNYEAKQTRFVKKEESEIKEIKVPPHIHIFFLLNPGMTFAEIIRQYVRDNWAKDSIEKYRDKKVYKDNRDKNMRYTEYLINQASSIRFINVNYSEELKDFPSEKYNFRIYHSAYINLQSYIWNNKQISDRKGYEKSVLKYNEVSNFYNNVRKYNDISGYEEK